MNTQTIAPVAGEAIYWQPYGKTPIHYVGHTLRTSLWGTGILLGLNDDGLWTVKREGAKQEELRTNHLETLCRHLNSIRAGLDLPMFPVDLPIPMEEVDGINTVGAEHAAAAVATFHEANKSEAEFAMVDLLTALMHLCDRTGDNFELLALQARHNYRGQTEPPLFSDWHTFQGDDWSPGRDDHPDDRDFIFDDGEPEENILFEEDDEDA